MDNFTMIIGFFVLIPLLSPFFLIWYMRVKQFQRKLDQIQAMDIDSKKIEIFKLQSQLGEYKTSHVLHFCISFFTFGFWAIIWFCVAQSNASQRSKIHKLMNGITGSRSAA